MKIALIDDEIDSKTELVELCQEFATEHSLTVELSEFSSGEKFLQAINAGLHFAVVFMDIYMDGMSGVDAAKKLREQDRECLLIFLTSSADHMPEAFSCHAFEYVTKPVLRDRLFGVLHDALKVLPLDEPYLELPQGSQTVKIFFSNIVYVVTDAHYLNISIADGSMKRVRMRLAEFMNVTGGDSRFIKVNKGVLLNADHVTRFQDNCCVMDNGEQLPIRVRNRASIEQVIRDYNFEAIRKRQRHEWRAK